MENKFIASNNRSINESSMKFNEKKLVKTKSSCLDFFMNAPYLKYNYPLITEYFLNALQEDKVLTIKILLYLRDSKNGLREKNTYRYCLNLLGHLCPDEAKNLIPLTGEYGQLDDLIVLMDTKVEKELLNYYGNILKKDKENIKNNKNVSVLCKFLPMANTLNKEMNRFGEKIAKGLGYTNEEYNALLTNLKENLLNDNEFEKENSSKNKTNNISKLSGSRKNYNYHNDYINKNKTDKARNEFPSDIVEQIITINGGESIIKKYSDETLNLDWNELKLKYSASHNYDDKTLVVLDTSSSMYYQNGCNDAPMITGISLAIFFGEMLNNEFNNKAIAFSRSPELLDILGDNICEKVTNMTLNCQNENVDLRKILELLLDKAINKNILSKNMPKRLLIISDLEFDSATSLNYYSYNNAFLDMKKLYEARNYSIPEIVFWNISNKNTTFASIIEEENIKIISGNNYQIMKFVLSNKKINSYEYMIQCTNEYKKVEGII